MCLVHQPNWIWTFKACLHITQTIAQHSFSVLRTFLSPLREWFTDDKRGTCVFGFHEWPRLLCNSKHIVNSFGSIHFHSLGSWQQSRVRAGFHTLSFVGGEFERNWFETQNIYLIFVQLVCKSTLLLNSVHLFLLNSQPLKALRHEKKDCCAQPLFTSKVSVFLAYSMWSDLG